jgi:4-hydroxy-tetrahydrodipicolinate reductase
MSNERIRVAIAGASGRMSRVLIETTLADSGAQLAGVLVRPGSAYLGQDAGALLGRQTGVQISDDMDHVLKNADVLIDFTRPEATLALVPAACRHGVKLVIGTTGFDEAQRAVLQRASQTIAMVVAPNMSVGVNVTFKLLEVAAGYLKQGYDIEIIEAHHRHKVDAPSGTALKMGSVIAQALGRDLETCAVYDRKGVTGERDASTIGFSTIRGGDIVGDHTVLFAGTGERIEISHKSASRLSYAQGSLRAAHFLMRHARGCFDMWDVLGLR